MPKTKEEYIALCRYYKGEEEMPKGTISTYWYNEKEWVERHYSEEGLKIIKECIYFYKTQGLEYFMVDDGTPFSLKAFLLAMYQGFTSGTADSFKEWYKYNYLQIVPLNSEK